MELLFLQVLVIIMLIFLILNYLTKNVNMEKFIDGYGSSFSNFYYPVPNCSIKNNCFKGFTNRGSIYTNICEPKIPQIPGLGRSRNNIDDGKLLRAPRPIKEECIRKY